MYYTDIGMMSRPETDWQDVDAMIEARNAREWEELNEEPKVDADEIEYQMDEADDDLGNVLTDLAEAVKAINGDPIEYRIMSIMSDVEALRDDLTSLKAKILEEVKGA